MVSYFMSPVDYYYYYYYHYLFGGWGWGGKLKNYSVDKELMWSISFSYSSTNRGQLYK